MKHQKEKLFGIHNFKQGIMQKTILFFILLLLFVSVASAENIRISGHKIVYDEIIEGDSDFDGINDRISYYLEDQLVFVAYDTDEDNKSDIWFTYVEGTYKELAMRDTTGDGKPEEILSYDMSGELLEEKYKWNLPWFWIIFSLLIIGASISYNILRKDKKKRKLFLLYVSNTEKYCHKKLKQCFKLLYELYSYLKKYIHKKIKQYKSKRNNK